MIGDGQPFYLTIDTELSESTELTTIKIPNFPYDLDVSVSNQYQNADAYANVQLSHFEMIDSKKPNLEGTVVDTVRDFARTAEKLIIK